MRLLQTLLKTMASNAHRLQRPIHLILDFDATLTVNDTIVLLREIPLQRNKRLSREIFPVPAWSALESAYTEDYARHKKGESAGAASDRSRPVVERARDYSQMLARRRVLEEQSMKRLEEWNFFRGVVRTDVCKAAETVVRDGRLKTRDHWTELLRLFTRKEGQAEAAAASKVSIISLNWSATFIRQSLLEALKLQSRDDPELFKLITYDLQIHSCEIKGLNEPNGSSGQMQADVLSSDDKLKYLPPASGRSSAIHPERKPDPTAPYLVYVGDSATDFDCLMAADTGVWLNPAANAEEAKMRCDQCFKPMELKVRPASEVDQGNELAENELVWAQNFEQITQLLAQSTP